MSTRVRIHLRDVSGPSLCSGNWAASAQSCVASYVAAECAEMKYLLAIHICIGCCIIIGKLQEDYTGLIIMHSAQG